MIKGLYKRRSGQIELSGERLVFTHKDTEYENISIPINQIRVNSFGSNNAQYSIYHPVYAKSGIVCQEISLLRALTKLSVEGASKALVKTLRKKRLKWGIPAAVAITVVALTFLLPLGFSWLPSDWINKLVSHETSKALGRQILEPSQHYPRTNDISKHVISLVEFLVKANPELQSIPIEVYVSKSKEINAFAAPGAILIVNQGLLNEADSIEEVLGVLSHELAHIALRHNIRAVGSHIGISGGAVLLSMIVGYEAVSFIGLAPQLINLKYSREFELASDARGFDYLHAAGISANGQIRFFQKLIDNNRSVELGILSTHPLSKERIEQLRKKKRSFPLFKLGEPPVKSINLLQVNPIELPNRN